MREHDDPFVFDVDMSESIDSPFEQAKVRATEGRLDEKTAADPIITANLLLKSRAIQRKQFQDSQLRIDDISWHILLDLTVSAQAGKRTSVQDLTVTHGLPISTMSRYVDYLVSVGMIVKNNDSCADGQAGLTLTSPGEALTSNALRKIGDELANI